MENTITFYINDQLVSSSVHPATVLLDFLRDHKKLTGTKEGCREGDCGACTVLLGKMQNGELQYKTVNSCLLPVGDLSGTHVVTVEGLGQDELTPVQSAMIEEGGSQCGFCTPGFVMSMTGFLMNEPKPDMEKGVAALDGNICRCTGYVGIKRALRAVINTLHNSENGNGSHIDSLIAQKILPEYFADMPSRLTEIFSDAQNVEDGTAIISGGTDLFVQKWESLLDSSPKFVQHNTVSHGIAVSDEKIVCGAAATVSEFLESVHIGKYFPKLQEKLHLFGSLPIRNRATLAGNICNASPIADMVNILLALDAQLLVVAGASQRFIPLRDFYLGYKTLAKSNDEIVAEIHFQVPNGDYRYNYEKVSRREYLDIASVNSTMYTELYDNRITKASISVGGVAAIPLYLSAASQYLAGKEPTAEVLDEVLRIADGEVNPIGDARGSAQYKRILMNRLIRAHFISMFPETISMEAVL